MCNAMARAVSRRMAGRLRNALAAVLVHHRSGWPDLAKAKGCGPMVRASQFVGELPYLCKALSRNACRWQLARTMRTRYKIDTFQQTYFVIDSFQQLFDMTAADPRPSTRRRKASPSLQRTNARKPSPRKRRQLWHGRFQLPGRQACTTRGSSTICTWATPVTSRCCAPGKAATVAGNTMLSQLEYQHTNSFAWPGGSWAFERLQPGTVHPHLAAIFVWLKRASQVPVGRSQRQHTVHARVSRIGAQPGPGGQAAHAVADQHIGGKPVASVTRRTASSMAWHSHQLSPARAPDSRPHAHGLQRADVPSQCSHTPRLHIRPCTSTTPLRPVGLRRQPVGRAAPPQRLAPAKINRAAPTLMPPRPKQLRCGGQRHCIAPVEALHQHQLDSQHRRQPHSGSSATSTAHRGCCGHHHTKQAAPYSNAKSRKVV